MHAQHEYRSRKYTIYNSLHTTERYTIIYISHTYIGRPLARAVHSPRIGSSTEYPRGAPSVGSFWWGVQFRNARAHSGLESALRSGGGRKVNTLCATERICARSACVRVCACADLLHRF